MLQISNLTVKTKDTDKIILQDINLKLENGKIYCISGQNGSGKSTLAQIIMGNPEYVLNDKSELTFTTAKSGNIATKNNINPILESPTLPINQINLKNLSPDQRSQLGIFVSMQYPTEVPGVNFLNYLKLIIELNRNAQGLPKLQTKQTMDLIHSKLELIGWNKDILKRNLNEGMSGGERKKSEILQMLLVDPKIIILDEIDSGLDKQALETIIEVIKNFVNKEKILILITHQQKILDLFEPDQIINFREGKVIYPKQSFELGRPI
jgi:Fe-S cluster assembly ATP-binding protein